MSWTERERIRQRDEAEASGEDLWTEEVPNPLTVRLQAAYRAATPTPMRDDVDRFVRFCHQSRVGRELSSFRAETLLGVSPPVLLDTIEFVHEVLHERGHLVGDEGETGAEFFERMVNGLFSSYRVGFKLVGGEFIRYRDDPVYAAIVEPTLSFLHGERWNDARKAYFDALREIQAGNGADAVTDAGTALQAVLKELGCSGNSLGPQIADAKKKGLLGIDPKDHLTEGTERFLKWAADTRNGRGDAHPGKEGPANLDDAWMMVYIVGALILRLASSPTAVANDEGEEADSA